MGLETLTAPFKRYLVGLRCPKCHKGRCYATNHEFARGEITMTLCPSCHSQLQAVTIVDYRKIQMCILGALLAVYGSILWASKTGLQWYDVSLWIIVVLCSTLYLVHKLSWLRFIATAISLVVTGMLMHARATSPSPLYSVLLYIWAGTVVLVTILLLLSRYLSTYPRRSVKSIDEVVNYLENLSCSKCGKPLHMCRSSGLGFSSPIGYLSARFLGLVPQKLIQDVKMECRSCNTVEELYFEVGGCPEVRHAGTVLEASVQFLSRWREIMESR